mgnify:CR=1 FL=1
MLNFGIFEEENEQYSYVEIAILISFLIESGAVDFVVTGCSSGQGMMLACNSLPGLLCGYIETPQDAFLFGRINGGNVASLPLGLNFGWQGELNLQYTLDKLFDGEFGMGYPENEAEILAAIDALCSGKTVISIAHRISTVESVKKFS